MMRLQGDAVTKSIALAYLIYYTTDASLSSYDNNNKKVHLLLASSR